MRALVLAVLVALPAVALADAPAPWAVCEGKAAGDSCAGRYFPDGVCRPSDAGCPGSDAGICLWCISGGGGGGGGGTTEGGGCSCDVGAGGAAGGAAVLGLAGVAALFARSRRR